MSESASMSALNLAFDPPVAGGSATPPHAPASVPPPAAPAAPPAPTASATLAVPLIPPGFHELSKAADNLLQKDYPIIASDVQVRTRAANGTTFRVLGTRNNATNRIGTKVEVKFAQPPPSSTPALSGWSVTTAWSDANVLRSHVELDNHIAHGFKLEAITTLQPDKLARRSVLLAAHYKQPGVHTRTFVDLFNGPSVTAGAVTGRDGFLAGSEVSYDVKNARISRYDFGVGFASSDYTLAVLALSNLSLYKACYHHAASPSVQVAGSAVYDPQRSPDVAVEVGAKKFLGPTTFVKAKMNNNGVLSFGYTQRLQPGVMAAVGLAINTRGLQDASDVKPAHKFGMSMLFEVD